jgi:hypothetical protein
MTGCKPIVHSSPRSVLGKPQPPWFVSHVLATRLVVRALKANNNLRIGRGRYCLPRHAVQRITFTRFFRSIASYPPMT